MSQKQARLTMVTLITDDMKKAKAFYIALGWIEEEQPSQEVAFFRGFGQYLGLYTRKGQEKDLGRPVPRNTGAVTLCTNYESRSAVDAAYADALAAGAEGVVAPEEIFWGGYSGHFADPDGHLWEVAHNPFWELNADGQIKFA